jgi:hypothetical protein
MSTITIGVDLAKSVFSVCEVDAAGHVQRRQDLGREAFALWLAQVPAGTVVAMEACSGAHHWARRWGSTPKSRTVVKGWKTSNPAWRSFVAFLGYGTARCIRTHRPLPHRVSGTSCGKSVRA